MNEPRMGARSYTTKQMVALAAGAVLAGGFIGAAVTGPEGGAPEEILLTGTVIGQNPNQPELFSFVPDDESANPEGEKGFALSGFTTQGMEHVRDGARVRVRFLRLHGPQVLVSVEPL